MSSAAFRQGLLVSVAVAWAASGCGRVGYELLGLEGSGGNSGTSGAGGASGSGGNGAGGSGASVNGGASGAGSGGAPAAGGSGGAPPDAGTGGDGTGGVAPDAGRDAATPEAGADSPVCVPAAVAPDYCTSVPRLCAPPVIDGVLDPGAPLRDLVPLGWNNATSPLPPESATRFSAAWRADGLYVFVEVTDATRVPAPAGEEVWRGDGVEIYVDADGTFTAPPAFDNPGSRQIQAAAPLDGVTPSTRGEVYTWGFAGTRVPWTSNFVVVPTAAGYTLEAFVTVTEMAIPAWSLAAGGVVGFDLGINVSDPDTTTFQASDGHRLGQYFLRLAGTTPPFFDVRAFCLPSLAP